MGSENPISARVLHSPVNLASEGEYLNKLEKTATFGG